MCTRIRDVFSEVLPHYLMGELCDLTCFLITISCLLAYIHSLHLRVQTVQLFHTIIICCSGCWLCLPFTVTCSPNIQRGKQFRLPAQTQCCSISFPVLASWDNAQMILACAVKWILALWTAEQAPLRIDTVHKQGKGCRNSVSCAITVDFLCSLKFQSFHHWHYTTYCFLNQINTGKCAQLTLFSRVMIKAQWD